MKIKLHRRSEPGGLYATIFVLYDWFVARQSTSFPLRHWNLKNLTKIKHVSRSLEIFSACTVLLHSSIMLPPHQPHVFAQLACWQLFFTLSFCLTYSISFGNNDFFSFKNYTKDWQDVAINHPILQTFTYRNKNKRRSYESQAQSPHLVAGKSEQNITTIKPFSLEPTREDGVTSSCSFMMHCTLVEWNAFWSKVINSRICTPFYILFLNSDYVVAHSTRTLCSNKHFTESITRKFKPRFFVQQCQKHVTKVDPSIHKNGYSML